MADVFDLQSEVAASVAKALEVELLPSGQARGSAGSVASTAAYEAYLKGRYHWGRRTKEGFRLAVEWFERAIAEDPGYARAYAGLADVYAVMPLWGLMPAPEAHAKAEPYAHRALELDPNLAEAHASYGAILSNKYSDFPGAERELRRAIELDPGYTTAHHWLGTALSAQNKLDEAEAAMERSRQMDPLSVIVAYNLANINSRRRRYDRALEYFRGTLELDPAFLGAYMPIAHVHAARGTWDEGIAYLSGVDARARQSLEVTAGLGLLHARAGHPEEARAILRDLAERGRREYVAPMYTFYTIFALGDRDDALRMLERGMREGEVSPFFIRVSPMWDMLKEDPRFEELLRSFEAEEERKRASKGGTPT
jgi:serine/threonine-protein kinase